MIKSIDPKHIAKMSSRSDSVLYSKRRIESIRERKKIVDDLAELGGFAGDRFKKKTIDKLLKEFSGEKGLSVNDLREIGDEIAMSKDREVRKRFGYREGVEVSKSFGVSPSKARYLRKFRDKANDNKKSVENLRRQETVNEISSIMKRGRNIGMERGDVKPEKSNDPYANPRKEISSIGRGSSRLNENRKNSPAPLKKTGMSTILNSSRYR